MKIAGRNATMSHHKKIKGPVAGIVAAAVRQNYPVRVKL
jgi:hypothetical protein